MSESPLRKRIIKQLKKHGVFPIMKYMVDSYEEFVKKELEAERSEVVEYNNNLEKTLRICLTVKPHTESVDAMKAMIKTLLENSLKK